MTKLLHGEITDKILSAFYEVYNVLGQTLASKNNVDTNQSVVSSIMKNNQPLIVKVTLANGQTAITKIIF